MKINNDLVTIMLVKRIKSIFIILLLSVFYLACSKKDTESCTAGMGGNMNLVAFPQHHSEPVVSLPAYRDTAYLKFNSSDFPGADPALYDAVFISDAGADSISMKGLKCGNYYVYIVAFHNSLQARITGGEPVSITRTDGEMDVTVPLSE